MASAQFNLLRLVRQQALGIAAPAIAAAGTYDLLNPGEMFRPKGYAQSYAEVGSEDRRQTAQPAQELVERFFMGRTGSPLKYETAKQDIPSLDSSQRYANYQNFLYNDRGLSRLSVLSRAPRRTLQGVPEVRALGFPVTLPMAGGFVAGPIAARQAMVESRARTPQGKVVNKYYPGRQGAIRGIVGGTAGSLAGVTVGNVVNAAIASANRPQLPTTAEYQQGM
jgi:hypothetical protein